MVTKEVDQVASGGGGHVYCLLSRCGYNMDSRYNTSILLQKIIETTKTIVASLEPAPHTNRERQMAFSKAIIGKHATNRRASGDASDIIIVTIFNQ